MAARVGSSARFDTLRGVKTVYVGLSGGVDSAVSAYLLKKEGYRVEGVFIKVWEPDFLPCTSAADRLDAMRVAAHLQIPFHTYNLEAEYKKLVVDYFIGEYRAGRTPNPDVMCNREIKFGAFWERAKADGADMIATGHYALRKSDFRNEKGAGLFRGVDDSKDQSYFLWTLTQDDLSHSLFPIGHLHKSEVRHIAAEAGLPNAAKKDSQGLCFLGHVDMKEFLQHYIPVQRGQIKNTTGDVVGEHDGVWFYTIDQRIPVGGPEKLYVVAKDVQNNELVVASSSSSSDLRSHYELGEVNWIRELPQEGEPYEAQIRYHGEKMPVTVQGNRVVFAKATRVAEGQSVVVYRKDTQECMGGGVVSH